MPTTAKHHSTSSSKPWCSTSWLWSGMHWYVDAWLTLLRIFITPQYQDLMRRSIPLQQPSGEWRTQPPTWGGTTSAWCSTSWTSSSNSHWCTSSSTMEDSFSLNWMSCTSTQHQTPNDIPHQCRKHSQYRPSACKYMGFGPSGTVEKKEAY